MPFRVNFPSFFMALIRAPTQAQPYQAVFRVSPAMNKLEIREYLTKIYGLSVRKVMTANMAGRRKRIFGARRLLRYKRPDFKKAYVTLGEEVEAGQG
ncbi:ribosomal protein [Nannochloropsis oceanica]